MRPFQDFPRSTALTVVCVTPNISAISRWSIPVAACKALMDLTFSRVSARDFPGDRAADEPRPTGETPVRPAGTQDLPANTSKTEARGTPSAAEISTLSRSSTLAKRLISKARAGLSVFPFRYPSAQVSLPAPNACAIFSRQETHSRLDPQLLDLFKSMWFTCGLPSGGSPINAMATCLWTWVSRCFPEVYSPICKYPLGLRKGLSTLGKPLRAAALRLSVVVLSPPRLLTSYPAYPTTGSHFSSSILNLSAGLLPSLRLISDRLNSAFSGIPQVLVESARQLRRLVAWPVIGAFPAPGLVCRS